ncbi:FAD-dependent oxidoreductase [Actinoplanes sp. NBRC 101535]|uniref:FAD-dependent oxidoreductase n=1 Tax=Actinoplanes sp. NBRC 101535 TaxID=3032196 RepID=UPI0024A5F778|nr:FAD-dependent oxidoreductase [Actinoplanes sp. NBRC 101535]GLY06890.1 FAD-dependent oxidoreductase [Actinoplanes sp. NBRC 101535]
MFKPKRKAVVVGAGIAGLATALRLGRDGWDVTVVERSPARRSSGYMVNLIGRGYDAAERLGLLPALRPRALGLFTTVLTRADGRPKFTVPAALAEAALGPRTLTVFRGDLESALFAAARDHADIRFGVTVTSSGDADINLSDGTSVSADLLVGADGVHSSTRGPDHVVDLPYVVAAFGLPHPVPGVPDDSATTFIGAGRTAAVVALGPGRSSAFFTYRCADPAAELRKGPAEALTAAFGDLGGGVPDALRHIGPDTYFDAVSQVVMPRWSTGRTVLVGDAAWCVTLFAGHGAALAMAGADELGAALLAHDDVPSALAAWEASLRPEVLKRQALARRGMVQYAPPSDFHVRMNDLTIRAMTLPGIRTLVRRSVERANR